LNASLLEKPDFDIKVISGNDKLTRFYTGIPTYDSFMTLVDYIEPKVKAM